MPRVLTDYFMQERHEISQLLNRLAHELQTLPLAQQTKERTERLRALCARISQGLRTHFDEEEKILYPSLEAHVEGVTPTLERMRLDRDAGGVAERKFQECLARLRETSQGREDVVRAGRQYIQWVRSHFFSDNGRLFPLVESKLDPETQREVRRAMEELARETSARIAEGAAPGSQA